MPRRGWRCRASRRRKVLGIRQCHALKNTALQARIAWAEIVFCALSLIRRQQKSQSPITVGGSEDDTVGASKASKLHAEAAGMGEMTRHLPSRTLDGKVHRGAEDTLSRWRAAERRIGV